MKSFDEWLDTTKLRGYMDENSLEAAWEAGQQSKQAEVDELQKRINEALHEADESCGVSVGAFVKLNKILKGNTNDH